jgi:hypothetical protein
LLAAVLLVGALSRGASAAALPPLGEDDLDAIDAHAATAMKEGGYVFCTAPTRPLLGNSLRVCPIAREVAGCTALVEACDAAAPRRSSDWFEQAIRWLKPIASALVYVLVVGIVLLALLPLLRWAARRRSERPQARDAIVTEPNRAALVRPVPPQVAAVDDADAMLTRAEQAREAGDFTKALGLYLAASLAALARRGALRLAAPSTNGEYVRACNDPTARVALREIVCHVDEVDFGRAEATADRVRTVAARANAIVRATAFGIMLSMLLVSCTPQPKSADPTGDDVPREVLRRSGFQVESLTVSLATLPIDAHASPGETLIVDAERVDVEEEARSHLFRWVEAGGTLILFGPLSEWPTLPAPRSASAEGGQLVVGHVGGARVGRAEGLTWEGAEVTATLGNAPYAVRRRVGSGTLVAVANDDLFTNVGVLPRRNAAALVALVRSSDSTGTVRIAASHDGVSPPANPFAALVATGLAKGAWHALAAALVLFLAVGMRHAAPRAPRPPPRRAFAEHVEATGSLYERRRMARHALMLYARFVEIRLRDAEPRGWRPTGKTAELFARVESARLEERPRGDELATIDQLRQRLRAAEWRQNWTAAAGGGTSGRVTKSTTATTAATTPTPSDTSAKE